MFTQCVWKKNSLKRTLNTFNRILKRFHFYLWYQTHDIIVLRQSNCLLRLLIQYTLL